MILNQSTRLIAWYTRGIHTETRFHGPGAESKVGIKSFHQKRQKKRLLFLFSPKIDILRLYVGVMIFRELIRITTRSNGSTLWLSQARVYDQSDS